ncbi:MAG: DNA polymerase III subunit delta', partial [Armatimonadota bacterium]|nr:DNA polymerase III subunit delta' [Armatimonadota bacterium]
MPRLSSIIGHEASIGRLQAAISGATVSHAYLLAGPSGTGKTTTARAFAKALNCEQTESLIGGPTDSCEICAACRQADAGVHPDIHLIRPALLHTESEGVDRRASTEILIAQVREMIRMLSLSPSLGRRKVFIVSPADAMNQQSQNALLKSLEEPPGTATLILCAESPESVLATIRSRCQVLQFGLAPASLIQLRLRELYGLPVEEAAHVAALAQGRVGRALQLASNPEGRAARSLLIDLLQTTLKAGPLQALLSAGALREAAQRVPVLVESLAGVAMETVSEKVAPKIQLQVLFEELAALARDLLLLKLDKDDTSRELIVNLDRKDALDELARDRTEGELRSAIESVLEAQDLLRRNVNPVLL